MREHRTASSDTAPSQDPKTSAGEGSSAGTRTRRWWLLAGVVVGLLGLGIRGWLHQQPINSDDIQYFIQARSMGLPSFADIRYDGPRDVSPNSLRFVFLYVPAATTALLGDGADAFYAAVYFIATLSFVGLFAFAWTLWGPRVAVIAAAIWATSYAAIAVDTRLVPDNLGTALALIGLALIAYAAGLGGVDPPGSRKKLILYAAIGGFLLWAAFSTRASFFVFALTGVIFGLLGKRRWTIVAALVAGGLLGQIFELLFFAATTGDPLVRWRALLGFGSAMTGVGTNPDSIYTGYGVGDLFTRYPLLLWRTESAELMLHFAGICVFVWWAIHWRQPRQLAKTLCAFLVYGFLTFAITRVDPVVPLMREKIRYYATAAPLFYIAVAEFLSAAMSCEIKLARFDGWLGGRARSLAGGVVVALVAITNLTMASDSRQFARNGNDGLLTAAEVLEADVRATGRPKVLYQDMRTSRVVSMLLSHEDGWEPARGYDSGSGTEFEIPQDGYLVLNWKRLNANVYRTFVHGPRTHSYYRIIETQPLVGRHRRGGELVDLFFISPNRIARKVEPISESFPRGWSRVLPRSRSVEPLPTHGEVVFGGDSRKHREYVYTGGGALSRPPQGSRLDGEQFFEAIVIARSDHMTRLRAYLYWWRTPTARVTKQYMGEIWAGPEAREFAVWTYLPQDAVGHRLVLRPEPGLVISSVKTQTLGLHPDDQLRQFGGAWPRAIPDKDIAAVAKAISADAQSRGGRRALYDELHADRVLKLMPEDQGWIVEPRSSAAGHVVPFADSYLVLSWQRLRAGASGDGFATARVHRYYRSIEDSFVVYRHRSDRGFIDVFFVPSAPVSRPVISEVRSFPMAWTRLLNSTKTWKPLDTAVPVVFSSEDPNDEYIYSGAGPVWRATTQDTSINGDQFFEVIVDARTDELTPLRAALFWWPEGEKEPRRQLMGKVLVGPSARQFAFWTYLPERALSHRVVFRSKEGVLITNVCQRVLERVDGDRVEQRGGAW